MARFILDIETIYQDKKIKNDFKDFMKKVCELSINLGSSINSISIIDEHNTAQFHDRNCLNKLTKKQIKKFNNNPHG